VKGEGWEGLLLFFYRWCLIFPTFDP